MHAAVTGSRLLLPAQAGGWKAGFPGPGGWLELVEILHHKCGVRSEGPTRALVGPVGDERVCHMMTGRVPLDGTIIEGAGSLHAEEECGSVVPACDC